MLLTREEMTFDFGGARFDPQADRTVLGWLLNQFLYGEVAANQIGEWLYEAPDLESARFLARQAVEELLLNRARERHTAGMALRPARSNQRGRTLPGEQSPPFVTKLLARTKLPLSDAN